jgi:hypothetical protein
MSFQEVSWSAFLREPSQVEPMLERGDVLLRRRDAEPLRLTLSSRQDHEHEVMKTAARLVASVLANPSRGFNPKTAEDQLPWTRFLPPKDRELFVTEFLKHFEACADIGDFTSVGRLLAEWKNTALVHADGLADRLSKPIKETGPKVRRPGK